MARTMIFAVLMAMTYTASALSLLPCKEYQCKAVTCGSKCCVYINYYISIMFHVNFLFRSILNISL